MSNVRFLIGDVRQQLARLPDNSVDLVVTSWPYWLQRSYIPADHPNKEYEIGQEYTVAEFLDTLLEVTALIGRVLTDHGSIAMELADTFSGSGGAGGDYNAGGMKENHDQAPLVGSAHARVIKSRSGTDRRKSRADDELLGIVPRRDRRKHEGEEGVIPPDKGLCMIPEMFRMALAYGIHPLTGETSPAGLWRCRNVVLHCRPNPSPGADADKFRPAKSDWVMATRSRTRYWDGFDVRVPSKDDGYDRETNGTKKIAKRHKGHNYERRINGKTAPLLDHWWEDDPVMDDTFAQDAWYLATHGYPGAHFATFSPLLIAPMVRAMCPPKVCTECGEPSRRILKKTSTGQNSRTSRGSADDSRQEGAVSSTELPDAAEIESVGWTECECDAPMRNGVVLDPFGGSGTTGMVASGHGRDAILIDFDERNADLAMERLGMFLTIEYPNEQEASPCT